MPSYVIKPDHQKDEYILWSTVVDNSVSGVLTRDEMFDFLLHRAMKQAEKDIQRQLDRPYSVEEEMWIRNPDCDEMDEDVYIVNGNDLVAFVKAQDEQDYTTMLKLAQPLQEEE